MNTSVQERISRSFPLIPGIPVSASQRRATVAPNTVPVNAALSINPRYATYYSHLSLTGHGTPLWIPEPNETQHINYRRQGTAIGDVVVFTPNGGLHFLFNICRDAHDLINGNDVPEGFSPFKPALRPSDIHRLQEYGEDSYLASKSIIKKRDRMGPAGIWFQSSASEGAILAMPEGAYSEDLARVSGFDRYLAENLDSWYHYVNEVREWGVEQGQLHLVTGVHKAQAWGIATFSNERTTANDLHMVFKSNDNISSGDLYSWEYEGIVDSTRAGPTRRQRRLIFEGLPEAEHQPFENQCLFVRTVNATVRKPEAVMGRKSDAIVLPASQANNTTHSTEVESSGSAGPNCFSSSRSGFNGVHDTSVSDPLGGLDNVSIARIGPLLRDHPSKAINDFLLREKPNGRIAITHDQDWISLLTKGDVSLPSGEELVARLMDSFKIIEDEGVISLEYKDPQSVRTSRRGISRSIFVNWKGVASALPDADTLTRPTNLLNKSRRPSKFALSGLVKTVNRDVTVHSDSAPSNVLEEEDHDALAIAARSYAISPPVRINRRGDTSPFSYADTLIRPTNSLNKSTPVSQRLRLLKTVNRDVPVHSESASSNVLEEADGDSLYTASSRGYKEVVKDLLERGVDVNVRGGFYGNALQAAAYGGHEEIVKLLLENGADINLRGGWYGNALQAASRGGHEDIVKLLQDAMSIVNVEGGSNGNTR